MLTRDLDYHLPDELIATTPADPRDAARLMVVHRQRSDIEHRFVRDLPDYLRPGDLLVFNQSKVVPASFHAVRAGTGGHIKGLFLAAEEDGQHAIWQVMLESRGHLQPGEAIDLPTGHTLELLESVGGGAWRARLPQVHDSLALLQQIGTTPLPPYIRKARRDRGQLEVNPDDLDRYNTVYAHTPGSVAAPTAGLHFTPELLDHLDQQGVQRAMLILHVGLGTFAPVRTDHVEDHDIHSEWIDLPPALIHALATARQRGGRIIPVGTTSVRALESLPHDWPHLADRGYRAQTRLFITPDYPTRPATDPHAFTGFRFTDCLMTNFHLPRSTLLALVAALPHVGIDRLKDWYTHAVAKQYRFYSYGDAMLLL